jgi:uncharacterized membrane protein
MPTQKLIYSEIFNEAWNSLKADLALVVGLTAVYGFGIWVLSHIPFVNFLFIAPIAVGYMRCLMQIRKKEVIGFNDFLWAFTDFNRFLHVVILNILVWLGAGFGMLLLIIPGIWFIVATAFSTQIFTLHKPDAVEAIKTSLDVVKGRWWNIAGFVFVLGLINLAGMICLFIGILISWPLTTMATLLATEKLMANATMTPAAPSPEAPPTVS